MTTTTRRKIFASLKAKTGHTTGEPFLEDAKDVLDISGGMSHSQGTDDEGFVSISFDPDTIDGGVDRLMSWLVDDLDVEFDLTITRWADR